MALFYVLQKISIPNYPAKFIWVNLMPFVNVNVDSYLPCGSRLKNEVYNINLHVSLCLSSVFIFTAYMFVATKMQAVIIAIIRCNCRMETTRHVVSLKVSVRRIEGIGRINKLVRVIVINEVQFSEQKKTNTFQSSDIATPEVIDI